MQRICALCTVAIAMLITVPANGNPISAFFGDVNRGYNRNRCWPNPFVYPDQAAARAPMSVMVHNGWRLQNLVADHYFEPHSAKLNEAGQSRIRWVITQAPADRRTVYVEQALTAEETEQRLNTVRAAAERFALAGEPVDVRLTEVRHHGWSGADADAINVKFHESQPDPRLPNSSGFQVDQ